VRLTEATPLAVWQASQRLFLVSRSGRIIEDARIERFGRLLVIVGAGAPAAARDLLDILASEPELARRVIACVRVSGRRWNLRLDNGVDVKLPEENPAAAWSDLARLERRYGILARDIIAIDLREPGKPIVRLGPTAIARLQDEGDDT
jgi:cell division protein FtsQ